MPLTILLTGFGPFPGAPFNPTGALVEHLARWRHPALANARRVAHVFATSYEAVDREFPALVARERPDVVLMFGLAARSRSVRIETRARNVIMRQVKDVNGAIPVSARIVSGPVAIRPLRSPAGRFLAAARAAGVRARLSRDAGTYLCNYLCWRASEAAAQASGPRLVAFIHVPKVREAHRLRSRHTHAPITGANLAHAGEVILLAALETARGLR
jgi:pyroglutamyl-peptidase